MADGGGGGILRRCYRANHLEDRRRGIYYPRALVHSRWAGWVPLAGTTVGAAITLAPQEKSQTGGRQTQEEIAWPRLAAVSSLPSSRHLPPPPGAAGGRRYLVYVAALTRGKPRNSFSYRRIPKTAARLAGGRRRGRAEGRHITATDVAAGRIATIFSRHPARGAVQAPRLVTTYTLSTCIKHWVRWRCAINSTVQISHPSRRYLTAILPPLCLYLMAHGARGAAVAIVKTSPPPLCMPCLADNATRA